MLLTNCLVGSDLRSLKSVRLYSLVGGNTRPQKKSGLTLSVQVLVKTIGAVLLPISLNIELFFYVYFWFALHTLTKIGATIDLFEHKNFGANTSMVS